MLKTKVGDLIEVTVSGIEAYGFFVHTDDNYSGLCHISEISNDFVSDVNKFVHIGERIFCQVLEVDNTNKQLKLSIKDIYYKIENDENRIVESRKGFLLLKKMLPVWINNKMKEYDEKGVI